ncbi:unnamed protein product [Adineta steineri]|uniref:Uncharacterized protein n=1 Tax=Adineta steineri TaxID=433720 RepID=A0A815RFI4_9BILA|nr:unnamed protein product [Adineta steineri]
MMLSFLNHFGFTLIVLIITVILLNFSLSIDSELSNDANKIRKKRQINKLSETSSSNLSTASECSYKTLDVTCLSDAFYRTFDGVCNNILNSWWGTTNIPFRRLMRANYADGFFSPRNVSKTGDSLPSPRVISNTCSNEIANTTERSINSFFTTFAQFIDHDLTSAANGRDDIGEQIHCDCEDTENPFCMNIPTPDMPDQLCMLFPRSSAFFEREEACQLDVREQVNQINSYLDASLIYGNDKNKADELRSFKNGQLKTTNQNLPPQTHTGKEGNSCRGAQVGRGCFLCGDTRSNENIGLTSIHAIFIRLHNNIALSLSKINLFWSDDIIYHEARRIVTAILQHITYKEFIPLMIGPSRSKFGAYQYDSTVDVTISNEFATAAYRFGHTLVNSFLRRLNNQYEFIEDISLSQLFFRPAEAYNQQKGGMDSFIYGLLFTPSSKFNPMFNNILRNHLFEADKLTHPVQTKRFDLAAVNINRGRDHGLPTYNSMRRYCGLRSASSFNDLRDTMDLPVIGKLASVYSHVDDIDLYVGGISERSVSGGIVGPTFACIIGDEFKNLRRGDRFFYETQNPNIRFTSDQLNEIRRVSLSSILCETVKDMDAIQIDALRMPNHSDNPFVSCSSLPSINLLFWRE